MTTHKTIVKTRYSTNATCLNFKSTKPDCINYNNSIIYIQDDKNWTDSKITIMKTDVFKNNHSIVISFKEVLGDSSETKSLQ